MGTGLTASTFVPLCAGGDLRPGRPSAARTGGRVPALMSNKRRAFPALIAAHASGHDLLHSAFLTGKQPWARLYAEGHGEYWGPAAGYIQEHLEEWTAALLE